jgi:hypothetical protein
MTDKYAGAMPDEMYKTLTPAKEAEFRVWVHHNWAPEPPPKFGLYHPVIRDEWRRIDEEMLLPAPPAVIFLEPVCEPCQRFFAKFSCAAATHGECDCPKCQGYCKCNLEVE